eukprot:Gb_03219 [translate_table: standard]
MTAEKRVAYSKNTRGLSKMAWTIKIVCCLQPPSHMLQKCLLVPIIHIGCTEEMGIVNLAYIL